MFDAIRKEIAVITPRPLMDPWRDAFLIELRLRAVPGPRIGDALAEVDAHCTDSGETPQQAFGEPVPYAQSWAEARGAEEPAPGRRDRARTALTAVATLCGISAVLEGVDAVAHGTPAAITVGALVGIGVVLLLTRVAVAVVFRPGGDPVAGVRLLMLGAIYTLCIAAAVVPYLLWKTVWGHVLLQTEGWGLLLAGLVLVTVGWWPLVVNWDAVADRVVDPRTGRESFQIPRLAVAFLRFGLPAILLVTAVAMVFLPTDPG